MDLKKVKVTWKENVIENDDDGTFELIDEDIFGYVVGEHLAQTVGLAELEGPNGMKIPVVQVEHLPKLTILWDNARCPAVTYEAPEKLYWYEDEDELDVEEGEVVTGQEFQGDDGEVIDVGSRKAMEV